MEKRNYVKPKTELHAINTASFIAGSSIIADTDTEINNLIQNVLDGCFRLKSGKNENVSNSEVISYIIKKGGSICITVGKPQNGETCNYGYTTENEGYKLTHTTGVSGNDILSLTRDSSCDGRDIVDVSK